MERLDERARRRPDFAGGRPVRMADGQTWTLAKPRVRFAPSDDDEGFAVFMFLGDDYQAKVDAYHRAYGEGGSTGARVRAEIDLGVALLQRNYDLTRAEAASVLQFSYDDPAEDPEGAEIRETVVDLALGIAPKPEGGTTG